MKTENLTAYCQIFKKNISAEKCAGIQGQDGCFGCAASSRLCISCATRLVKVPAVGLCSQCLALQLAQEIKDGQVFYDRPLCEKCKDRPVRFQEYGLCLACSVAEFGGKHQASLEFSDTADDDADTSATDIAKEKIIKTVTEKDKEKEVDNMSENPVLCSDCNKEPVYVKGLGKYCYMKQYKENIKKRKEKEITELATRAREFIISNGIFSKNLIRTALKTGSIMVDILTERLEKEGVIHSIGNSSNRRWEIKIPTASNMLKIKSEPTSIKSKKQRLPADKAATKSPSVLTTGAKIEKLQALIHIAVAINPDGELAKILEETIEYLPIIEQIKKLR